MPDKSFLFDFGGMTPQDINRVQKEIKESGNKKFEVDAEVRSFANEVGNDFLVFLQFVFKSMGLINEVGLIQRPIQPVAVEYDENTSASEVMSQAWNKRAHDWAIIESPHNYAITMQTLLEFFRVSGKDEKVLSLGSGPGLYETYLGQFFLQNKISDKIKIICVDAAKEMTRRHREILDKVRIDYGASIRKIENVEVVTGDMSNLDFPSGSIDQIICNNSLQWVPDWKKVIAEMHRVMNPKGLGWLYLFVHTHPMGVRDKEGKLAFEFGNFQIPDLLDVLEENCFSAYHTRQIRGSRGVGQMGGETSRVFLQLVHKPAGNFQSWRTKKTAVTLSGVKSGR